MKSIRLSYLKARSLLKKLPVFSSLNVVGVHSLIRSGEFVRYTREEVVSLRGAPQDFVFFLLSGRIVSSSKSLTPIENATHFVHKGMVFGLISALTGSEHSETFQAVNDSFIFRISAHRFKKILKNFPHLGLVFSKILSHRLHSEVTRTELVKKTSIISVYSPVIGTGGSTYALNLALQLKAQCQRPVVLISLSRSSHANKIAVAQIQNTVPYWKEKPISFLDIAKMGNPLSLVKQDNLGIGLLNIGINMEDIPSEHEIPDFVSHFMGDYAYVILDLPSGLDHAVIETLAQSDTIHLMISSRREDLRSGRAILQRLNERFHLNMVSRLKVVVTRLHVDKTVSDQVIKKILGYDVIAYVPTIEEADLESVVDTSHVYFATLKESSLYAKAIRRLARQISGRSIGLVLGGGAAFGLAHIGILKVLEEENIPVDIIAGSSMGALIGSFWALGFPASEIEEIALAFRKKANLIKLLDLVFPLSGLISGKAIMSWLRSHYKNKTFNDTRIPLKIVAYDLLHRQEIVIESGSIVDAVRKSISIPGVFQPVLKPDQWIIDGGVMNPLPTNVIVDAQIKRIIAVNVLQNADDVIRSYEKTKLEIQKALGRSFWKNPWYFITIRLKFFLNDLFFPNISDIIVRTLEASESVIAEEAGKAADVLIHPDLEGLSWFELYRADVLIQRGEEATRKQIEKIKALVSES